MENCFERTICLIGISNEDPVFETFIRDLKDEPVIFSQTEKSIEYHFKKSGIYLSFSKRANCFFNIFFQSSESQNVGSRYMGGFPGGVEFGDSQETVHEKLAVKPAAHSNKFETEIEEVYEMSNLAIRFWFKKTSRRLCRVQASLKK